MSEFDGRYYRYSGHWSTLLQKYRPQLRNLRVLETVWEMAVETATMMTRGGKPMNGNSSTMGAKATLRKRGMTRRMKTSRGRRVFPRHYHSPIIARITLAPAPFRPDRVSRISGFVGKPWQCPRAAPLTWRSLPLPRESLAGRPSPCSFACLQYRNPPTGLTFLYLSS